MSYVTCVTCGQILSGSRCTNELCPGFVPDPESDDASRLAAYDALARRAKRALEHPAFSVMDLQPLVRDIAEQVPQDGGR